MKKAEIILKKKVSIDCGDSVIFEYETETELYEAWELVLENATKKNFGDQPKNWACYAVVDNLSFKPKFEETEQKPYIEVSEIHST